MAYVVHILRCGAQVLYCAQFVAPHEVLPEREAQMRTIRRPYRRTHTITFWGCDEKKLLSPMTRHRKSSLIKVLIRILTDVGFAITPLEGGRRKDVYVRAFGAQYGFTGIVILSESHCSIHTYPEEEYGCVAEVEFNLCYLTTNHMPKLKAFAPMLAAFLGATRVTIQHSRRRYFSQA